MPASDESPAIACPACCGAIVGGPRSWACSGCGAAYRGLRGVVDLRSAEDVFLPNREDWGRAERLDAAFDRLDFGGMLDLYFDLAPEVSASQRAGQVRHIGTAPGRARAWLDAIGPAAGAGPMLDLGCGSGSFLAAAADDPGRGPMAGVDIAMRWLLVARKRLDEAGLGRVPLVCAGAERLPFADGAFAAVVAGDVIEHVADAAATLAEAHRVLRPGGRAFFATPNRFSLAPEPHVGIWGVGFLPRRWMAAYVRRLGGGDFRAIHTRGAAGWRRLVDRSPFGGGRVGPPPLPKTDLDGFGPLKRALGLAYNRAVATGPGRLAARWAGPMLHIACDRRD